MKTKILFVRHGHSEANRTGVWAGHIDVALTETGYAQAEKMAKYVTEIYDVDAIYASTLKRASDTAKAIANILNKEVYVDKRLCEIYGGEWEGLGFDEIKSQSPKQFQLWQDDMSRVCTPSGENIFDVQKRGIEAITEICENNSNKTIVIVTHRVMLRTIQCLWENKPLNRINECGWIDNCSVSEVIYENGKLIPVKINQADFLGNSITRVNAIM